MLYIIPEAIREWYGSLGTNNSFSKEVFVMATFTISYALDTDDSSFNRSKTLEVSDFGQVGEILAAYFSASHLADLLTGDYRTDNAASDKAYEWVKSGGVEPFEFTKQNGAVVTMTYAA